MPSCTPASSGATTAAACPSMNSPDRRTAAPQALEPCALRLEAYDASRRNLNSHGEHNETNLWSGDFRSVAFACVVRTGALQRGSGLANLPGSRKAHPHGRISFQPATVEQAVSRGRKAPGRDYGLQVLY